MPFIKIASELGVMLLQGKFDTDSTIADHSGDAKWLDGIMDG